MKATNARDDIDTALAVLRVHDAERETAERIRQRCLASLSAARARTTAGDRGASSWRGWLEPALAIGLGAIYLAAAVSRVIAVYRTGG